MGDHSRLKDVIFCDFAVRAGLFLPGEPGEPGSPRVNILPSARAFRSLHLHGLSSAQGPPYPPCILADNIAGSKVGEGWRGIGELGESEYSRVGVRKSARAHPPLSSSPSLAAARCTRVAGAF
eukprot:scaffold4564_cov126-Isochrysis_galbana.AAC.2